MQASEQEEIRLLRSLQQHSTSSSQYHQCTSPSFEELYQDLVRDVKGLDTSSERSTLGEGMLLDKKQEDNTSDFEIKDMKVEDRQRLVLTPPSVTDMYLDNPENLVCFNCQTTKTATWRKNDRNENLCNACGLYEKAKHAPRPLHLVNRRPRKSPRPRAKANKSPAPLSNLHSPNLASPMLSPIMSPAMSPASGYNSPSSSPMHSPINMSPAAPRRQQMVSLGSVMVPPPSMPTQTMQAPSSWLTAPAASFGLPFELQQNLDPFLSVPQMKRDN
eukprot:comp21030_c0_seq1/m.28253 comp21030_c0_seq1/g.28253  ORF comp21030_c0_seq1/g.28253 comp21030_c0_seq1/m.28253 type:complete len:274 (-) comp21030_c0_seq1:475-1296(-)